VTTPIPADPYVALRERLTITRNPLVIIASPLAWRSAVYAVTSVMIGGLALLVGLIGLPFLPWIAHLTTVVERRRMALLGLPPLVAAAPVRPSWRATFSGRGDATLGVWAITGVFGLINAVPGGVVALAVVAGGVGAQASVAHGFRGVEFGLSIAWVYVAVTLGLYVAWVLAAGQAYVEHSLLLPYSSLTRQVVELTSSRSELVDVFEAERRRIERDLHDGAQQHLVVSTMRLGEAIYWLDQANPDGARDAVLGAQSALEDGMAALRTTIRGIHPQVLTDRGLVAALQELTARQIVATRFEYHGTPRALPPQVESAAYYVVSEALTNVAKHSAATQARVQLVFADHELWIELSDNGHGGARWVPGHGISGLAERTQTAAGNFSLTSPDGGPTTITITLPYDRQHAAGTR
jgi:signal transduction histidine kinase